MVCGLWVYVGVSVQVCVRGCVDMGGWACVYIDMGVGVVQCSFMGWGRYV